MMLPKKPLNQMLPVRFRNGEQIRQFSKPCVRCGHMLNARDMRGAARLIDDHLAISVNARCPQCGESFGVACIVDNQKRVRRVLVPALLFGWYLRSLPPQRGEDGRMHSGEPAEPAPAMELPEAPAAQPLAPPAPQPRDVERAEEAVGRYQGQPIPAWVKVDGQTFTFERVAPGGKPRPGEFLLDDCLIYRLGH
ncbi:hypothetical protein GCM10007860_06820 [Chitiniphilus shinanonensis]|uniref:Uncharacterized protein n=1 Tax=Chitiniphilus shinanonensis TaxID=553088 RepID=A0ABQ6BQ05_9NEIS|nr:hypothetical protein [Chitiniphilus shinanonensis]GLS03537.1 hypothetical protein GCM10007860_06820 [Chitiniphilus shinanonensis]